MCTKKPEVKNNMTYDDFYKIHQPAVHVQVLNELMTLNQDFVIDSWMRSMMLGAKVQAKILQMWKDFK